MKTSASLKIYAAILSFVYGFTTYGGVDYHNQNIGNIEFTSSSYDSVDFTNSNFSSVIAKDVVFSSLSVNRNFTGSNFTSANLTSAIFNSANLVSCDFTSANLYGTYFISADLTSAVFTNSSLSHADFTNAVANGFTSAQLYSSASYYQKDLQYVSFQADDMNGWNFNSQNLTRADFSISSVKNADFRQANLTNAIFSYTDVSGADFRGSSGATFSSCTTSNTILSDGNVSGGSITLSGTSEYLNVGDSSAGAVLATAASSVGDGAKLVFMGKKAAGDNAEIDISGAGVSLNVDSAKIDVYLAEDFSISGDIFLTLLDSLNGASIVCEGLSKDDVEIYNYNGSTYSGAWNLQTSTDSVGIRMSVPESVSISLISGLSIFVFAFFKKGNRGIF